MNAWAGVLFSVLGVAAGTPCLADEAVPLEQCIRSFENRIAQEVIEHCTKAIVSHPLTRVERSQAHLLLGFGRDWLNPVFGCADGLAESSPAYREWQHAAYENPSDAEPLVVMAMYHLRTCGAPQALELLTQAETVDPKDHMVHVARAETMLATGVHQAAVGPAKKAVELAPARYETRRVYGQALLANHRFVEAILQLTSAADLYSEKNDVSPQTQVHQHALTLLARAYSEIGLDNMAAAAFERYVREVRPEAHFSDLVVLADYLIAAGRNDDAITALAKARLTAPPAFAEEINSRQKLLAAKSGNQASPEPRLVELLSHADLKTTLRIQVFLRNQGYDYVEINGRVDDPTRRAASACMIDRNCSAIAGEAI